MTDLPQFNRYFFQENFNNTEDLLDMESLHFGEDYRLFLNSLSDNSVSNDSKNRSKKFRRKNKRRDVSLQSVHLLFNFKPFSCWTLCLMRVSQRRSLMTSTW